MDRRNRAIKDYNNYIVMPAEDQKNNFWVFKDASSGESVYLVDLLNQTCFCPDFIERQVKCKHIWRVELGGFKPVYDEQAFSPNQNWKPDGFTWFDALKRSERFYNSITVMLAPGQAKQYKFWIILEGDKNGDYTPGQFSVFWGSCNDFEIMQRIVSGQGKEVPSIRNHIGALEAERKKRAKGYNLASGDDKKNILVSLFGKSIVSEEEEMIETKLEPKESKTETKPAKEWKPEGFTWF